MDASTIQFIANFAEIFGVLAVVGSLGYVGVQIRQNTLATQIAAAQASLDTYRGIVGNFVSAPGMADVWARGLKDVSTLKQDEIVRFFAQVGLILHFTESSYLQWKRGALIDDNWIGIYRMAVDVLAAPGARQFWDHRRHWFGDEFQHWVEDSVFETGSATMYPQSQISGD